MSGKGELPEQKYLLFPLLANRATRARVVGRGSRKGPKTLLRVLIVEDNAGLRSLLRRLLQDTGRCEVVGEIAQAGEACGVIRRTRPHVVIMDDSLPDADPVETTRDVTRLFRRIHLVAFTARSDPAAIGNFLAAGASAQVDKVDIDALIDWIVRHSATSGGSAYPVSGTPDRPG